MCTTPCLLSSSQTSPALHRAPPGGELPGHRVCASPLLLWAVVNICNQRAGAGQAGGVQHGCRPERAAQLLQPTPTHRARGDGWAQGHSSKLRITRLCFWTIDFIIHRRSESECIYLRSFVIATSRRQTSYSSVCVPVTAGLGGFPPHYSTTQSKLSLGSFPRDSASCFLHRLLSPGNSWLWFNQTVHSVTGGGRCSIKESKSWAVGVLSAQAHPQRLQILVAVVQYKTKLYKPRRGLCSTWLASLDPAQGLFTFWLPKSKLYIKLLLFVHNIQLVALYQGMCLFLCGWRREVWSSLQTARPLW